MARLCSRCKFYTDCGETVCPKCHVEMQFTLLPPPGQEATPMPLLSLPPEPRRRRQGWGASTSPSLFDALGWYRRHRLLIMSPIGVIMIIGSLLFGWGKTSVLDRFDYIEVGMSEQEVRTILSPPIRSRKWRSPEWHNKPVLSTNGYATLHHSEAGVNILIEFMDGAVTRKSLENAETASR